MSVASRIEAIEEHIGNIYDTLEVGGADLTNVNKNIVNINSQLKDRMIDYLNNGTQEIWDNWEKVTGEGTELSLSPTLEAPMKLDLKGNTSQETTTGKNLFSGDFSQFDNQGGTGTTYGYFKLPTENETYTITMIAKNDFTPTMSTYLGFTTNGGSAGGNYKWVVFGGQSAITKGTKITATNLSAGTLLKYVSIYSNFATTLETFMDNFYIQLEKGEGTYYEPYTGGVASPNPDYPQDIHVVSGDNIIQVCGRNLLNLDNYLWGYFEGSETQIISQTTNSRNIVLYVECKPNTQYYIKATTQNVAQVRRAFTYEKPSIGTTVHNSTTLNLSALSTGGYFTTTEEAKYIVLRIQTAVGYTINDIGDFLIEPLLQISQTDTSYKPYRLNEYNINLPVENLLNIEGINTEYGITSIGTSDGRIVSKGIATNTYFTITPISTNNNCDVPSGTYTFSIKETLPFGLYLRLYDNNSNILGNYQISSGNTSTTFTITTKAVRYRLYAQNNISSGTSINATYYPMLEKGDVAHDYTAYGETIKLCDINDYQDKIINTTGKNLFNTNNVVQNIVSSYTLYDNNNMQLVYTGSETFRNLRFQIDNVKSNTDYRFRAYFKNSNSNFTNLWVQITGKETETQLFNASYASGTIVYVNSGENTSFLIRIYAVGSTAGNNTATWNNIELVEADKFGKYEPYGSGEWYWEQDIGKIILDGNEGWGYDSTYNYFRSNTYDFGTQIPLNGTTGMLQYSNYFNLITPWNYFRDSTNTNGFYWVQNSGYKLAFRNINYTLTADFRSWLSEVKPIVIYPLATPNYIKITNETLINQLDTIKYSMNSQTNISQKNNDLPFELDVTALKEV